MLTKYENHFSLIKKTALIMRTLKIKTLSAQSIRYAWYDVVYFFSIYFGDSVGITSVCW